MQSTIEKVTQCKLIDYELLPVIANIQIPILIMASKEDSMINWDHSEKLYN
jgi:esterase/lipase